MRHGSCGLVGISVDLPTSSSSQTVRSLDATASSLATLFERHHVQATWGVDNLSTSRDLSQRLANQGELALLADPSWVGPDVSRRTLCRHLDEKMNQAVAAGVELSTILLRDTTLVTDTDVWIKHGFQAVREAPNSGSTTSWLPRVLRPVRAVPPEQVRYGLWRVASPITMPGDSLGRVRQHLDAAVAQRQPLQMTISAEHLTGKKELSQVEAVLRQIDRLRAQRRVQVVTLANLASLLTCPRTHQPAQSILRKAA